MLVRVETGRQLVNSELEARSRKGAGWGRGLVGVRGWNAGGGVGLQNGIPEGVQVSVLLRSPTFTSPRTQPLHPYSKIINGLDGLKFSEK